jgi:hypothetical protein
MGCFSWITQNSNRSIIMDGYGSRRYPCRTCYMWDNKGRRWRETSYEGYGVFGGKDFYVLLAEMNKEYSRDISEEQKRTEGIHMYFGENGFDKSKLLFPNLTDCSSWTWRNEAPESCGNQGSGNWTSFDESESEDEDGNRTRYKKTDKFDGWANGEMKS